MLSEITIRNFALIDSLDLRFSDGLNVLTGETGAGKSIVLDALALLLGERATSSAVRKGADSCDVICVFDIRRNKPAEKFLESIELDQNGGNLIIRRNIDAAGRSKSTVNDKPVTLSTLASLGDFLVDLHGQHEHQLLLRQSEQKILLDRYGGNEGLCLEVAKQYAEWQKLLRQKNASQISEQERSQKIDLYRYQLNEIDESKLRAGEEEEIETLLPRLKNSEKLQKYTDEILQNLNGAEGAVLERLEICRRLAETIQRMGVELEGSASLLEQSLISAKELTASLENLRKECACDPQELDALISRTDLIARLKKKYGSSIEEIIGYRNKIEAELKILENYTGSLNELEKNIQSAYEKLIKQCEKLSLSRRKASDKLSHAVQGELEDLGVAHARFRVALIAEKDENGKELPTAGGLEKAEFLFSANPGEEAKPLRMVASGGELSRIMLALKKVLAENDKVPTLVFDEIDAGVGGSTGNILGEKLKFLSRSHQVILVTHLPQIAAFAKQHLWVRKAVTGKTTKVFIETLEDKKRIEEVARMLGGVSSDRSEPTPVSLKHASELLLKAR